MNLHPSSRRNSCPSSVHSESTLVGSDGVGSDAELDDDDELFDEIMAEIRDVADVAGDGFNTGSVRGGEVFGETEEHAVHVHEQVLFSDVSDTWPLGEPAVFGVIVEAAFGEQEGLECSVLHDLQTERAFIPTDGPYGIFFAVRCRADAFGASYFCILATLNNFPS